jgi:hypothetical protein
VTKKDKKKSLNLVKIYKKKGLVWNEEAFASLKNDKYLAPNVKGKISSDILFLIKLGNLLYYLLQSR